jgi:hypothetical protein
VTQVEPHQQRETQWTPMRPALEHPRPGMAPASSLGGLQRGGRPFKGTSSPVRPACPQRPQGPSGQPDGTHGQGLLEAPLSPPGNHDQAALSPGKTVSRREHSLAMVYMPGVRCETLLSIFSDEKQARAKERMRGEAWSRGGASSIACSRSLVHIYTPSSFLNRIDCTERCAAAREHRPRGDEKPGSLLQEDFPPKTHPPFKFWRVRGEGKGVVV